MNRSARPWSRLLALPRAIVAGTESRADTAPAREQGARCDCHVAFHELGVHAPLRA